MKYSIYYDLGRPTVLVGSSVYHENLRRDLSRITPTEICSLEHILSQTDEWLSQRQFFHATSNLAWKKHLTEALGVKNPAWISVINENSEIDESCFVGRGVWINNHNILMDHCNIGDHSVITNQCLLGHHVDLGEFSHLAPRCYLSWCSIGRYNCLASNCTVLGSDHSSRVSTADRCNFTFNTVLNKNISLAGTYRNKKLIDARDSLTYKFF
jgi:serine acetyltransferase